MGIDLKSLVLSETIDIPALADKVIAVDAFNAIYQFLATIRGPTGELLSNSKGEVTSHISGLYYRNINLLSENLRLIYIFDGKPSQLKMREIERRREIKKQAQDKYNLAIVEGRIEEARKFSQATSIITPQMIEESKEILSLLGIPHIVAPSEGEATAAFLTRNGLAYACCSQDYDSILFGAQKLLRNLTISGRRKVPGRNVYLNVEPEVIDFNKTLANLKLSLEQLVDVAILIGTDFNPGGVSGIGPKTAVKLIKENGRLENIDKLKESLALIPFQEIRDLFLHYTTPPNLEFKFNEPDYEGIVDYLAVEKNFSAERVSTSLEKLRRSLNAKSQSLEKWF